ncbi:UNVERIFIED_CONTAM: hypothetical protein ABIE34_003883, partial [Jeotgalibacillus campisalis]
MGAIGQMLARRARSPRADALLRQRSLRSTAVPVRTATSGDATAADTLAGDSPSAGLLPGFESLSGLPEFSTAGEVGGPLAHVGETLRSLRESAAGEARLFGFVEAADFAGRVEEISRSLEYLQVVAAQAVERTRKEARQAPQGSSGSSGSSGAVPEWRTGWTEPGPGSGVRPESGVGPACTAEARSASAGASVSGASTVTGPGPVTGPGSVTGAAAANAGFVDDGYRNAAEFLRARLRISI